MFLKDLKKILDETDNFGIRTEALCDFCREYITHEHGGVLCAQCNRIYCCDPKCVNGYNIEPIGYSQKIPICRMCDSKTLSPELTGKTQKTK